MSKPSSVGIGTYLPGATFGPRNMRDYEFVWIIEGNSEYSHDQATVAAPPGSIVLCRPGARDFFRWDRERRTRHGYFHFQVHAVPASWPSAHDWPLVRVPEEGDILRPLFRHVLTWAGRGDALLAELIVMAILAAYVTGQTASGDVPREALPDAVDRTLRFIRKTLDRDPSSSLALADLANAAAVTPEHLCRLFKTATGHSPGETVRLARLDRAVVLLARSNYSIGEIAQMCGFASPFHFSRRFKEAFGSSPRDLRNQFNDGATPPVPLLHKWNVG